VFSVVMVMVAVPDRASESFELFVEWISLPTGGTLHLNNTL
jgi:hypothetical protein